MTIRSSNLNQVKAYLRWEKGSPLNLKTSVIVQMITCNQGSYFVIDLKSLLEFDPLSEVNIAGHG